MSCYAWHCVSSPAISHGLGGCRWHNSILPEVERMSHSPVRACDWQRLRVRINQCAGLPCSHCTCVSRSRHLLEPHYPMNNTFTPVTHEQTLPSLFSQSNRHIPGKPVSLCVWAHAVSRRYRSFKMIRLTVINHTSILHSAKVSQGIEIAFGKDGGRNIAVMLPASRPSCCWLL